MANPVPDGVSLMLPCPLCARPAHVLTTPFDGYVEGYRVSIYGCMNCYTNFSSRLDVPAWLYDSIYENAEDITGYNRYSRYLQDVLGHPAPLQHLADEDLPYWFVRQFLQSAGFSKSALIVELGCGTGYLTYALRRAGYACVGVDVSEVAIDRAREIFGHHDWFMTTEEFNSSAVAADIIIGLELVEHVPDPTSFVAEALAMIRPGGAVLLSTPNRDALPRHAIWASDPPPVHLFWFSRESFRAIGEACSAQVSFPGSAGRPVHVDDESVRADAQMWPPTFTAEGELTTSVRRSRYMRSRALARAGRLLRRAANRIDRPFLRALPRIDSSRGECETLAVVLRHTGAHARSLPNE